MPRCSYCGKKFPNQGALEKHISSDHGGHGAAEGIDTGGDKGTAIDLYARYKKKIQNASQKELPRWSGEVNQAYESGSLTDNEFKVLNKLLDRRWEEIEAASEVEESYQKRDNVKRFRKRISRADSTDKLVRLASDVDSLLSSGAISQKDYDELQERIDRKWDSIPEPNAPSTFQNLKKRISNTSGTQNLPELGEAIEQAYSNNHISKGEYRKLNGLLDSKWDATGEPTSEHDRLKRRIKKASSTDEFARLGEQVESARSAGNLSKKEYRDLIGMIDAKWDSVSSSGTPTDPADEVIKQIRRADDVDELLSIEPRIDNLQGRTSKRKIRKARKAFQKRMTAISDRDRFKDSGSPYEDMSHAGDWFEEGSENVQKRHEKRQRRERQKQKLKDAPGQAKEALADGGRRAVKEGKKTSGGLRKVITGDAHGGLYEHWQDKAQKRDKARAESAQAATQAAKSNRLLEKMYEDFVGHRIEKKFLEPLWELYTSIDPYRRGPKITWAEKKEIERWMYDHWDGSPMNAEDREEQRQNIKQAYDHFLETNRFHWNRHGWLLDHLGQQYFPSLGQRIRFELMCRVPGVRDVTGNTSAILKGEEGDAPTSPKGKTAAMFWMIVFFNAAVSTLGSLTGPAGLVLDPANLTFGTMSAFAMYYAGSKWYAQYGFWLPFMGEQSLVSAFSTLGMYILWAAVVLSGTGMVTSLFSGIPVLNVLTGLNASLLEVTVYQVLPVSDILGVLGAANMFGFAGDQLALLAIFTAFALWSGYHLWMGGLIVFMIVFGGPATAIADIKGILDFVGNLQIMLGLGTILYNMSQTATGWMNILGALGVVGALNVYYGEHEELEKQREKVGDHLSNAIDTLLKRTEGLE